MFLCNLPEAKTGMRGVVYRLLRRALHRSWGMDPIQKIYKSSTKAAEQEEKMEVKVHDGNFETEVLKAATPVLVDFYADWCGPCKMMAPAIGELAEEYEGRVKVCKCNVDESMNTAMRYQVQSIPMLCIFKNGEEVFSTVGVTGKEELAARMDAAL